MISAGQPRWRLNEKTVPTIAAPAQQSHTAQNTRRGDELAERPLLLRVSDAGRSQRCGLHRGRRPKAFNEGTRGKLQAVAPRAPSAMEGFAPRDWGRGNAPEGGVGWSN